MNIYYTLSFTTSYSGMVLVGKGFLLGEDSKLLRGIRAL